MGEVKIKSGNLIDNWEYGDIDTNGNPVDTTDLMRTGYIPIEVDKIYSISREITTGYWKVRIYDINKTYIGSGVGNIDLLWNIGELTPSNPMQNGTSFTKIKPIAGNAYFMRFICNGVNFSENAMMVEGDYIPSTIPEYQPYFINRPAHQVTNGQWVDIPTHHYTNGRWQGELTSQSPLKFWADREMLDWRVEGKTSGNLVESVTVSSDQSLYGISLFLEAELKPDTLYTFAFQLTEGYFVYWNEYLFTNETPLVTGAGDTVLVVTKRTRSDISKDQANQYRSSKGWVTHKNMKTESFPASYTNVQLLEGSYTADTLPPYEPYGGVGDWDETEQKYRIPVTVNGTTTNLYADHQLMDGDSLDYTTDQTTIPITQGDNTLTVETAVQPSKVFVKFEG